MGDVVSMNEFRDRFCNRCKYSTKYGCLNNKSRPYNIFDLWLKGKRLPCFEAKEGNGNE